MDGAPGPTGALSILIPLVILALVILRNARTRTLKVERLWIAPVVILAATGLILSQQLPPGLLVIGLYAMALAVGAALGWWRGRLTDIAVDPQTHALTSRASPVGMLLILAIFAVRYALRATLGETASVLRVSPMEMADAFLLLAVGLVCVQRLEIALRARRLLAGARGAGD